MLHTLIISRPALHVVRNQNWWRWWHFKKFFAAFDLLFSHLEFFRQLALIQACDFSLILFLSGLCMKTSGSFIKWIEKPFSWRMPWITEHSMASPFHILWVTNYQREKAVYTTIPGPLMSSLLSAVSFQVIHYETFLTVWWLLILRRCLGMLPVEGEAWLSPSLLHREQSVIPPWQFWSHSADDQETVAITAAGMGGWPGLICFVIRVWNSFLLCSSSSEHSPLRSEQVQKWHWGSFKPLCYQFQTGSRRKGIETERNMGAAPLCFFSRVNVEEIWKCSYSQSIVSLYFDPPRLKVLWWLIVLRVGDWTLAGQASIILPG